MSPGLTSAADVVGRDFGQRSAGARDHASRARLARHPAMVLLLGIVAFLGCQRSGDLESQVGVPNSRNHAPMIRSASLLPSPPHLNAPISVTIDAQDVDRNPISFRYEWIVNGQRLGDAHGEQLRPELLKRGDHVAVEIWPHDGTIEGASLTTPTVTIGNTPPVVSQASLEPAVIAPGMRVRVNADVQDADHDLTHVVYRWWRNQALIQEGESAELDTTPFVRGDTLAVDVVASDNFGTAEPVRVGPSKILNTAPRIVSAPPTSVPQDLFAYQVEAHDDESDALTFSLERAPAGMAIDERKGLITWRVPAGQTGTHTIRILVTDSQGAASFQEFNMTLTTPVLPDNA